MFRDEENNKTQIKITKMPVQKQEREYKKKNTTLSQEMVR